MARDPTWIEPRPLSFSQPKWTSGQDRAPTLPLGLDVGLQGRLLLLLHVRRSEHACHRTLASGTTVCMASGSRSSAHLSCLNRRRWTRHACKGMSTIILQVTHPSSMQISHAQQRGMDFPKTLGYSGRNSSANFTLLYSHCCTEYSSVKFAKTLLCGCFRIPCICQSWHWGSHV
jgi:hypothetical protein